MTATKQKPEPALTFVVPEPSDPTRRSKTVAVAPLDGVNRPDCPEDEAVEVVLIAGSYGQMLNSRYRSAKARVGKKIDPEWAERQQGDRFFLDALDLPRLLELGAVRLPEEIGVDVELDVKAAELETERLEVERERDERTEKMRAKVEAEAVEAAKKLRAKEAREAVEAVEEADADVKATGA